MYTAVPLWRKGLTLARRDARLHPRSRGLSRVARVDFAFGFGVFAVGLALAITHPWSHAYVGAAQYGDAAYWDFAGENWARGYIAAKTPDIRPGYSLFLGVVYALFGANFAYAFIAQAVLYAAGGAMVYSIGHVAGGRLTGLVAAALLVFDPFMWEWTATSTTESLGVIIGLAAVTCLVMGLQRSRRWWWIALFGIALAAANSVRPVTLPFLAPALLVLLLLRERWSVRLRLIAIAIVATLIGLLPGVLYQYAQTGDANLSSNTAANLFAASSPQYGTWTPQIYADIAAQLSARGVEPSAENVNTEFVRQAIRNYVDHPGYQLRRIAAQLRDYLIFEGEAERPAQYTFFRSPILALSVVATCLLVWRTGQGAPLPTIAVGLLTIACLYRAPVPTIAVLQTLGLVFATCCAWRRRRRQLAALAIAGYWAITGLSATVSAGLYGFLLHRLYTQVEPAHALLLALGVSALLLVPARARSQVLSLRDALPQLPRVTDAVRWFFIRLAVVGATALVAVGGARLALANIAAAPPVLDFVAPTDAELMAFGRELNLPVAPEYVDTAHFGPDRVSMIDGSLPERLRAYAMPGQFTRFLWYLADQDRTLFWYVWSEGSRPVSLDRMLMTGEVSGQLLDDQVANRDGLLVLVPVTAYFEAPGDVLQNNFVAARAFAPWDAASHRFRLEAAVEFPLTLQLYDHQRFGAAVKNGKVDEAGLVRAPHEATMLRALRFGAAPSASVRYPHVWVPTGGRFDVFLAIPPGIRARIRVIVDRDGARDTVVDQELGASSGYVRVTGDLGVGATEFGDLTIEVTASSAAEVLVAEPRIVLP